MRRANEPRQYGFTLVELLVVIAIIGLIISLILVAAADGVRRAEERATQALITKIETGISDRLDALLNTQPPVNQIHRLLAAISYAQGGNYLPVGASFQAASEEKRAQVIAQFDYIRAELPDVFFLNGATKDGSGVASSYPLNFAAAPYPPGGNSVGNFTLPIGNGLNDSSTGATGLYDNLGNPGTVTPPVTTSGMFGASFSAAGGLYRQIYEAAAADAKITINAKLAYDGVDNDGVNGIDDFGEVGVAAGDLAAFTAAVSARLNKHTHKTARSETLYAILVDGLSPLGSNFGRDDFTAREVQDTDGDGLLEFVDAWGEPLQFYRWPIFYGTAAGSSDSQKGSNPYLDFTTPREQDPLDPNQLLMSTAWWSVAGNPALRTQSAPPPVFTPPSFTPPNGSSTVSGTVSQAAVGFMNYFHILVDTLPGMPGQSWDRGGVNYARRAYLSRFLIVSGGADKVPGVGQLSYDYSADVTGGLLTAFPSNVLTMEQHAQLLTFVENQAGQSNPSPTARTGAFYEVPANDLTTAYIQNTYAVDDITNHNIQAPSTGVR